MRKLLFTLVLGSLVANLGVHAVTVPAQEVGGTLPAQAQRPRSVFEGEVSDAGGERAKWDVQRKASPDVVLQQLLQKMRTTKEEDKVELREKLKEVISEQIDRDIEERRKKLAAIEARIEELKQQLETRTKNKEQTIQMLMMFAENPDLGLGIPSSWLDVMRRLGPNGNRVQQNYQLLGGSLNVNGQSSPLPYPNAPGQDGPARLYGPGRLDGAVTGPNDADPFGPSGGGQLPGQSGQNAFSRDNLQSMPARNLPSTTNEKPRRSNRSNQDPFGGSSDSSDPFGGV